MTERFLSGRDRLRPWLTVAAIAGAFGVNALSNVRPLNGQNIGQLSNTLFANVLITPANYAFAIWGVIYLGLIGFSIYQFLPPANQHPRIARISYAIVVASLAQAIWVYLFLARQFVGSMLAMTVILLGLIVAYLQLEPRRSPIWQERWLLQLPLSLYLGWISVATVVNGAIALYSLNWSGWGLDPVIWTAIMLGVTGGLGGLVLWRRQDVAFAGVFVWAWIAIAVKRSEILLIAEIAIGLAVIVLGAIVVISYRQRRTPRTE